MSLRRLLSVAVAGAALAAGVACDDDPLSPEDVAGTYVLSTLRGESLPAVLWETATSQARLVADTLRLNADGTGAEIAVYEFTGTLEPESGRSEELLQFEIRGGRLEGAYICTGFCLAVVRPIRGVFTPEGLRLEVGRHGDGPIDFVRAGS